MSGVAHRRLARGYIPTPLPGLNHTSSRLFATHTRAVILGGLSSPARHFCGSQNPELGPEVEGAAGLGAPPALDGGGGAAAAAIGLEWSVRRFA